MPNISSNNNLILGIDPGTATTGYCVYDTHAKSIVTVGVITTKAGVADAKRIEIIFDDLTQIISEYRPYICGIEKVFFAKNVKTAITVSQARGAMLLAASKAGLEIVELTPLQVKLALVGYGQANKKQIQEQVKMRLKLTQIIKPDDASDAVAICLTLESMVRGMALISKSRT